jgi:hypothetical protein
VRGGDLLDDREAEPGTVCGRRPTGGEDVDPGVVEAGPSSST